MLSTTQVCLSASSPSARSQKALHCSRRARTSAPFWVGCRLLERDYADRLLPVDLETSHVWGELTAGAQKVGKTVAASDGLIAATH
jgi:predicted nucleic acid-binding protein